MTRAAADRLARARRLVAGLALGVVLAAAPAAAASDPYRLHPQDRLLIRVMSWDFRQNSMTGWEALSGEYTISPEGDLHLPLAGALTAAGLTQAELADALSELLRRRAGLDEYPQFSVEIVASLPVFVLGVVEQRGAVPFHPGLTGRQALALAGGIYRAPDSADIVRGIMLSGEATAATDRLNALQAEKARIEAELASLETGDSPAAPGSDVQGRLQDADRLARQVRLDSYADLQLVLRERAARIQQQIALCDQQIETVREQLGDITSLNERGLAVTARVTALSMQLNDLEAKRLELETTQLMLDEQLNQASRDSNTITTDAVAERLRRLAELESEISAAIIRERSARAQFGAMMETAAPRAEDDVTEGDLLFFVTRDGQRVEVSADAPLQPGDTLNILPPDINAPASAPTPPPATVPEEN